MRRLFPIRMIITKNVWRVIVKLADICEPLLPWSRELKICNSDRQHQELSSTHERYVRDEAKTVPSSRLLICRLGGHAGDSCGTLLYLLPAIQRNDSLGVRNYDHETPPSNADVEVRTIELPDASSGWVNGCRATELAVAADRGACTAWFLFTIVSLRLMKHSVMMTSLQKDHRRPSHLMP
jgi:hypothetical protein